MQKIINSRSLELIEGDITEQTVDAVVNAANSALILGAGVAGAIRGKGGPEIQAECDQLGGCPVGNAVITIAGNLKARYVIHAVGPQMGEGDEDNKLKNAVNSLLKLADQNSFKSISMPAISSGIFGFPKDRCAEILVSESARFLKEYIDSTVDTVEFCIFDNVTLEFFKNEFAKVS